MDLSQYSTEELEGMLKQPESRNIGGFLSNIPASAMKFGEGVISQVGEGVKQAGLTPANLLTGKPVRDIIDNVISIGKLPQPLREPLSKAVAPVESSAGTISKPNPMEGFKTTDLQPIAEATRQDYIKSYGSPEAIKETAYKDPVRVVADIGMLLSPISMLRGKGIEKSIPTEKIATSRMIAEPLQHGTVESIGTIPEFREIAKGGHSPELIEKFEQNFQDSLTKTQDKLHQIGNEIYNKPEIKNAKPKIEAPTLQKVEGNEVMMSPSDRMSKAVDDFRNTAATSDDFKALKDAEDIWYKVHNSAKDGSLNFDTLKRFTKQLEGLSQKESLDYNSKRMFGEMRSALVEARNNIPELKNVSAKYKDLMTANDLMTDILRLSSDSGEITAAKKIARRYKDATNVEFNNKLNELKEILERNPESKDLADFVKNIKILQGTMDISRAKSMKVKIPIVSKLPFVGKLAEFELSPRTYAEFIARKAPESYMGEVNISKKPYIGHRITKARAYSELLGLKTPNVKIPPHIKAAALLGLSEKKDK